MASEVLGPSSDVTGSNIRCPNSFIIGHFDYSPDKPAVGVANTNVLFATLVGCAKGFEAC